MKVLLGVRINPLNGFMCLDCTTQPGESNRILPSNPTNLDDLIDNNEVDEMIIQDMLDFLPAPARQPALMNYLSKISHNGRVVITGMCPMEIGRLLHQGQLNTMQLINDVVYGNPVNRKSWSTANDLKNTVLQTGQFILVGQTYNSISYCLTFRRK